jgi:hypothetical protein
MIFLKSRKIQRMLPTAAVSNHYVRHYSEYSVF